MRAKVRRGLHRRAAGAAALAATICVVVPTPTPAHAQTVDDSCAAEPWPERAADPVNVSGFALHPPAFQRLTEVELYLRDEDGELLDAGITSADGAFELSAATGLEPTRAVLEARSSGLWPSFHHFDGPLAEPQGVALLMFDHVALSVVDGLSGVQQDDELGLVHASFRDCTGSVTAGVRFEIDSVTEHSRTLYLGNSSNPITLFSPTAEATSERGDALLFNVEPGWTTVRAIADGKIVAERRILVRGGAATGLTLTPRAREVRVDSGPCSYPSRCGPSVGCSQGGAGSPLWAILALVATLARIRPERAQARRSA